VASEKMPDYLRLDAFGATLLVTQPFAHLMVPGFVGEAGLGEGKAARSNPNAF
jgi:hypothetical protein